MRHQTSARTKRRGARTNRRCSMRFMKSDEADGSSVYLRAIRTPSSSDVWRGSRAVEAPCCPQPFRSQASSGRWHRLSRFRRVRCRVAPELLKPFNYQLTGSPIIACDVSLLKHNFSTLWNFFFPDKIAYGTWHDVLLYVFHFDQMVNMSSFQHIRRTMPSFGFHHIFSKRGRQRLIFFLFLVD